MNEDKKEFYKRSVIRDKSILGAASNTLRELKDRWPERAEALDEASDYLLELRDQLTGEGWRGYARIKSIPVAEEAIDETLEVVAAQEEAKAFELKKQAEELAKAEKAKKEAEVAAKKAALQAELKDLEGLA